MTALRITDAEARKWQKNLSEPAPSMAREGATVASKARKPASEYVDITRHVNWRSRAAWRVVVVGGKRHKVTDVNSRTVITWCFRETWIGVVGSDDAGKETCGDCFAKAQSE